VYIWFWPTLHVCASQDVIPMLPLCDTCVLPRGASQITMLPLCTTCATSASTHTHTHTQTHTHRQRIYVLALPPHTYPARSGVWSGHATGSHLQHLLKKKRTHTHAHTRAHTHTHIHTHSHTHEQRISVLALPPHTYPARSGVWLGHATGSLSPGPRS